ncbi:MAG TPA: hypothetical protein VLW84_07110 [Terriglobales bacterium]|nr:hypothetical protein [Terriglobales bacterium]
MDRRRCPRVSAILPVRVWGLDAYSLPFAQAATVTDISSSGAVIQGMNRRVRPGAVLEVQLGDTRSEFRVVWIGRPGTPNEGTVGLESVVAEERFWDVDFSRCQLAAQG